ncbi:MAG: YkvA family protein [Alcanivorax sp.]|nr:YkvA family protein [Alcanivorax sp.]
MPANPFVGIARRRALRILRSATATQWLARAVLNRGESLQQRLGDGFGQLKLLAALMKDWATGRYREIPWGTLVTLAAALVYFLMPLDAIPDAILVVGLVDDLALLRKAMRWAARDIEQYRRWRQQQGDDIGPPPPVA